MMEGTIDKDPIKQRIKKLLALSKSPNENEAAAALEKANRLMEHYGLSSAEHCSYVERSVKATKAYSAWRANLVSSICWLYAVQAIRQPMQGSYRFIGEDLDVFFAQEMFCYLVKTIERMARQNIRKRAKAPYRNSYKLGIASNLSDRIYEMGKEVSWAPERDSRRSAIKAFAESHYKLKGENPKPPKINQTAAIRGYAAGDSVSIARQTDGSLGLHIGCGK